MIWFLRVERDVRATGNRGLGASAAGLTAAAMFFGASGAAADDIAVCADIGRAFLTAEAAGATDERTIRLADGREVRLAEIAALHSTDGTAEESRRATEALRSLVGGRRVALHGRETADRYGRLVAQVTLPGDSVRWVQSALVYEGVARVAPRDESTSCTKTLLAREERARAGKLGIWSSRAFAVREPQDIETLKAEAGRYTLVEGSVRRVGESGGRVLLDFGRHFSRDFSIVIPREAQKGFAEAGVDLRALPGKRVRARGVIFDWGGPAMELRVPAALELLDQAGLGADRT
jgi:endonuclease YncB( thermonuclease family)